jgi:two-component system sensor histidine kinase KdpD
LSRSDNDASPARPLEGLEVLPRAEGSDGRDTFRELDVEAVIARGPDVVLIDDIAHTNAPGFGHAKRWEDVEQVLAAASACSPR